MLLIFLRDEGLHKNLCEWYIFKKILPFFVLTIIFMLINYSQKRGTCYLQLTSKVQWAPIQTYSFIYKEISYRTIFEEFNIISVTSSGDRFSPRVHKNIEFFH